MIYNTTAALTAPCGADLSESEGYLLKMVSGKLIPCAATSDEPLCVAHIVGDIDEPCTASVLGCSAIVGIKLGAAPGTITPGTKLVTMSDGRAKALPTTAGSYVLVGVALEDATGDQIVKAITCIPTTITIS